MGMGGGSNRAQREAEAQERQRQEAIRSGTERVRSTFAAPGRQAEIGEFVDATRGLMTNELNRQQRQAVRGNRFALARSGQLGGSLQVDRNRRLDTDYTRGLQDVERRAQGAGADLRAADEDAQARLIGLVQGGLDATTAATQAAQSMRSNLAAGQAGRSVNDIGNAFGGFADFFQQSRDSAARRRADRQFGFYQPMFGGRGG